MQLQNATVSLDAPLQYPLDVAMHHQFAGTKRQLQSLTGKQSRLTNVTSSCEFAAPNAWVVSQALGLPVLPTNSTLAARRQQITDFLGCAMRA